MDERRRANLIELMSDANPEVAAPPDDAAACWTEQEIRDYFKSGGRQLGKASMEKRDAAAKVASVNAGASSGKLKCQRIGCDATYTEDDNPEGGCRFHEGPPVFHDGGKEWGCCKMRSHDFATFMSFPGCKTGKHSQEKPAPLFKSTPAPAAAPIQIKTVEQQAADTSGAEACNRCRQGFFCSDHPNGQKAAAPKPAAPVQAQPKAPVDPNAEQTCKNKGCGLKFREKDNSDDACSYHPGPPIFHERQKGWACCKKTVYDFDDFLKIPNCSRGRHNADPEGTAGFAKAVKK